MGHTGCFLKVLSHAVPASLPEGYTWTFPFQVKFRSSVFVLIFLPKELEWLLMSLLVQLYLHRARGEQNDEVKRPQDRLAGGLASNSGSAHFGQ